MTSEFPWKTLKLLTAIAVGVADEKEVKCRFSNGKHLERDLTINTGERILFQNYLFAAFTTRKILLSSSEKHIHLSVGGRQASHGRREKFSTVLNLEFFRRAEIESIHIVLKKLFILTLII